MSLICPYINVCVCVCECARVYVCVRMHERITVRE